MAGLTAADLLIGRIDGIATGIADRRAVDAARLPEDPLRTPETAQAKHGGFRAIREGANNAGSQCMMDRVHAHLLQATRQGILWINHLGFLRLGGGIHEKHCGLLLKNTPDEP